MVINFKQHIFDLSEDVYLNETLDKLIIRALNALDQTASVEETRDRGELIEKIKKASEKGADYSNVEQKKIDDMLQKVCPSPSVRKCFDQTMKEAVAAKEASESVPKPKKA